MVSSLPAGSIKTPCCVTYVDVLPKIKRDCCSLLIHATSLSFIAYHPDGTPIYQDVFTKAALTSLFKKGVLVPAPATESAFPIVAYKLDGTPYYQDENDDLPKSKKKKKSSQQMLKERYEAGDPTVGLLGEHSGKFDYYVQYSKPPEPDPALIPPLPSLPILLSLASAYFNLLGLCLRCSLSFSLPPSWLSPSLCSHLLSFVRAVHSIFLSFSNPLLKKCLSILGRISSIAFAACWGRGGTTELYKYYLVTSIIA